MTDNEIIAQINHGNEGAFNKLVNRYQEMVLNICYGFLNNREDALDLTQDVFVKVFFTLKKFRGQSKFSTWLYRIAVNSSINYLKKNKKQRIWQELDVLFEKESNSKHQQENPAHKNLESEDRKAVLFKAMESLPDKQKTAITLNRLQEFSYKEVAAIMKVNTSEVGVLINRGMKKVRSNILKEYKKEELIL